MSHLRSFTLTLLHLNSSLNPLIYCWKMRHIRHTPMPVVGNFLLILSVFSNIFRALSLVGLNLTFAFFNAFLSFTAIVLNIITMQALRKTSSLPKTLKTLLLSLAVSDLGVGLLVQPLYVALLVTEKNSTAYSTVKLASSIPAKILVFASNFGVFALAVDRFLAIYLHLRYQELVTHKRVVAVVISVWVFSASISYPSHHIMRAVIVVVCVITTGLLYCKIYASVRHHTNQIHRDALQVQQATQNEDMANAARLKKSSLATFYVYFVYLVCYLPFSCFHFAKTVNDETPLMSHLRYFILTLVYLNSSLNPLIYCWRMRHIRHTTTMDVLNVLICVSGTLLYHETFKSLLLSLCISDLGVGFLIQPLYVAYLTMEITKNSKKIDNFNARIQTEKYEICGVSIPVEDRRCLVCKQNQVEDEQHFLMFCNGYNVLRHELINGYVKKKMASAEGLHLTLVINCFFNAFLSFTAIVLNIITMQALRKTS
ncbi:unnamed protein product [Porites lobata]|uniref:G-protein coupled receptors family 1 profile domain-containing protein n=1 Tax=Porites lobata TaxID=104759 RepID=A0ABN8NZE9_9CNID|nr:unnamed protein product [Porites lobata]